MKIKELEKEIEELIKSYEDRREEIIRKSYIKEDNVMVFYNINKLKSYDELYIIFEGFYIVKKYKR